MIEMRENPDIMIVMPYFKCGSIVQAEVCEESKLVTAFGQLLDCLTCLQTRGITHRDIKPDNVLVELAPHFKVTLSDFGLSKAVTDTTWLQTFCGTLKYTAPEVFPFSQLCYGPPADVWSLGVMALEWLYGIPAAPAAPNPAQKASRDQWRAWSRTWVDILTNQLDDQKEGADVDLLQGMLVVRQTKRLSAYTCLEKGLRNGLFKRRTIDGLVTCARTPEEGAVNLFVGEDAVPVPTLADAEDDDSHATIIVA
jgi:serine/threonine protein kinase